MKYLLIILLSLSAQAKVIKEGDTSYQCKPMATCEDQLKKLKAENASLRKQLKEKKTEKVIVEYPYPVEKVVKVTKIKKHIISVLAVDGVEKLDASQTSSNTAKASVKTGPVPALTYQYQMDVGLTFLGGASFGNDVKPMLGLGFEF